MTALPPPTLITGASKGLGEVAARAFAAAGRRLVLTGRNAERLEALCASLPGSGHRAIAVDMLEADGPAHLAESLLAAGDVPQAILHCMGGGYGFREPLLTAAQLQTLFTVNLGAGADLNRRLIPAMQAGAGGSVVHVGSIASAEAVASVGYTTVKAALAAYVRSLGRELAGSSVIVTGILPGAFFAPDNAFRRLEATKPEVVEQFIKDRLPRGRVGQAEELIPLLTLLTGPGASMMAGSCIACDAGEGRAIAVP